MGLPSKKRSKSQRLRRASHFALKKTNLRFDADGNPYLPHHVVPATGDYKGKKVLKIKVKAVKK
jgi:ribosomal protein L32